MLQMAAQKLFNVEMLILSRGFGKENRVLAIEKGIFEGNFTHSNGQEPLSSRFELKSGLRAQMAFYVPVKYLIKGAGLRFSHALIGDSFPY